MERIIEALNEIEQHARLRGHDLKPFRLMTYQYGSAELVIAQCRECKYKACFDPYSLPIQVKYFFDQETKCKINLSDDELALFGNIFSMFDQLTEITNNVQTLESVVSTEELAEVLGVSVLEIEKNKYQKNKSAMIRYREIHQQLVDYLSGQ